MLQLLCQRLHCFWQIDQPLLQSFCMLRLADQRLLERNIQRAERVRSLDPPPLRQPPVDPMAPVSNGSGGGVSMAQQRQQMRQAQYEPVAGFGPPGGNGSTNVRHKRRTMVPLSLVLI